MKVITTLLAVLALASFTTVNAQEKGKKKGDPEAAFKKMDTNGDGSVSKEEFMASPMAKKDAAKAEKAFGAKDKDKDGKLSKEEFMAQGKKKKD
jgi:Ca2+-binding EF-hand superfamily protein